MSQASGRSSSVSARVQNVVRGKVGVFVPPGYYSRAPVNGAAPKAGLDFSHFGRLTSPDPGATRLGIRYGLAPSLSVLT